MIEKFISPFIESQFPAFYREEGQNFIAFVKSYYEWLELPENAIGQSRSLIDSGDLDNTMTKYISYFKKKYINNIPENIAANKRFLIKHIVELYKSKGTKESYNLLFRLLFNEDIDVYIPGEDVLKPSSAKYVIPKYIEISSHPYLQQLVGKIIYSSGNASAVVESYSEKKVQGKTINVLYLSNLEGNFKFGDRIYSPGTIEFDSNSPNIFGSLSAISILNGASGYNIGDELRVYGKGSEAIARVNSIKKTSGLANFILINGGYGFSTNAQITVTPAHGNVTVSYTGSDGDLTTRIGDTVYERTTGANGTIVFANTSTILIGSNNGIFQSGHIITTNNVNFPSSINATISSVSVLTYGSGATFAIGDIVDRQVVTVFRDIIENSKDERLENATAGFTLVFDTASGSFTNENVTSSTNVMALDVRYMSGAVTNNEILSNNTIGVTDLRVYNSDKNMLNITGTDAAMEIANLVPGIILSSSITGSTIMVLNKHDKVTITGNATVNTAGSTASNLEVYQQNRDVDTIGYFIPGSIITGTTSGTTANVVSVYRKTDFSQSGALFNAGASIKVNLDSKMAEVFNSKTFTIGTISYLKNINQGSGYTYPPTVEIVEPDIYNLRIPNGIGGYWGADAVIKTTAGSSNGTVTSLNIIDSGFGYEDKEYIYLTGLSSSGASVAGVTVVDLTGLGSGYYEDNKGFVSGSSKIQDSEYYQDFSYEIIAPRMLETYKALVKDLVHPSGIALYGKFSVRSYLIEEDSQPVYFNIQSL